MDTAKQIYNSFQEQTNRKITTRGMLKQSDWTGFAVGNQNRKIGERGALTKRSHCNVRLGERWSDITIL